MSLRVSPNPTFKAPWRPGPAAATERTVLVSYTQYTFRWRDLPAIAWAGMRLRKSLSLLPGAVGVSLYIQPLRHRVGSLTAWESDADLKRFVVLPYHLQIMRKYRTRGSLKTATWPTDRFSLADAYTQAPHQVEET